jgi:F0F1-type ATP synthase membrane subunit b/b'
MAEVEKEAYGRLQATIRDAVSERQRIVTQAQQGALASVQNSKAEILKARDQAMRQLRGEVAALALQAAEKILDKPLEEGRYTHLITKEV